SSSLILPRFFMSYMGSFSSKLVLGLSFRGRYRCSAHIGTRHSFYFRDGVIRKVDGFVRFPNGLFIRSGHETECLAVLQVNVGCVPDDPELLPSLFKRVEL